MKNNKKTIRSKILSWSIRLCIAFLITVILFIIFINLLNGKGDFQRGIVEGVFSSFTNSKVTIGRLDGAYFFPDIILKAGDIKGTDFKTKELKWKAETVEFRISMRSLIGGIDKYKFFNIENIYIPAKYANGKNLNIDNIKITPSSKEIGQFKLTGKWGKEHLYFMIEMPRTSKEGQPEYFTIASKTPYILRYSNIIVKGETNPQAKENIPELGNVAISLIKDEDIKKQSSELDFSSYPTIAKANINFISSWNDIKADFEMEGLSLYANYKNIKEQIDEITSKEKIDLSIKVKELDITKISKENSDFSKLYKSLNNIFDNGKDNSPISLPIYEANVNIDIEKVIMDNKKIANLSIPLKIKDKAVMIDKISGNLAGGEITGQINLLPSQKKDNIIYDFDTKLSVNDINFGKLQESIDSNADLEIDIKGNGKSWNEIYKSLKGEMSFIVANGQLNSSILDIWGGGLIKALIPTFKGDKSQLNCVIADFKIENEKAISNALLIDTKKVTVKGEGEINIMDGSIKFKIEPDAKDTSFLDLGTAMKITGTINEPKITPDIKSVGKKGIGALFGLINPALLLITLTDFGVNENHPCHKFIEK